MTVAVSTRCATAHAQEQPSLGLAVVTRDWEGGRSFLGPLVTSDMVRPGRSSQMVLGRLRLSTEHLVSFVQLGLGYWRLDQELMPRHVGEVDRAGQVGAGVEWTILPGLLGWATAASIGVETESTVLMRGRGAGPSMCHRGAAVAVGMLVARVVF
jgi:hypothetical protein